MYYEKKEDTHQRCQNARADCKCGHRTNKLQLAEPFAQHVEPTDRIDPRAENVQPAKRDHQAGGFQSRRRRHHSCDPHHVTLVVEEPLGLKVDERNVAEEALFLFGGRGVSADGTARVDHRARNGHDGVVGWKHAEEGAGRDALCGGGDGEVRDGTGESKGQGEDVRGLMRTGEALVRGGRVEGRDVRGAAEGTAVVRDGGFEELGDNELVVSGEFVCG